MICESDTPMHFYKVKAHISVVENESADAIAKRAAFHEYGRTNVFLPLSPSGSPFSYVHVAEEKDETTHTTS